MRDSNLPTGGFIASSGLESWIQHGLLVAPPNASDITPQTSSTTGGGVEVKGQKELKADGILDYITLSLQAYAALNLVFLQRLYELLLDDAVAGKAEEEERWDKLKQMDNLLHASLLNHVARRASTTQGMALLTLYERSFAPPESSSGGKLDKWVERARREIRTIPGNGASGGHDTEGMKGHLTTCFTIMCAALGLSLCKFVSDFRYSTGD